MIQFKRHVLSNGLKVLLHKDTSTPLAAVNILYNVGAKDEDPEKTGFAHLFEHLMFGGSVNIPNYDEPLQWVGGENNAFTNNDITNYYLTLPAENLETGLWLESDRMMQLNFSQDSLDVQKGVVVEEFKQRYLNQPYGDVWLLLRPLAYKKHPYQWPTIGKNIDHVKNATLSEVEDFFYRYYRPNNAILVIAGNIDEEKTIQLVEKWFGDIPPGKPNTRLLPVEPKQTEPRKQEVFKKIPQKALYMAFPMCSRTHKDYIPTDIISDILSRGNSSRLYQKFVMENPLFSSIDAYITGDIDPGLFVVSGKLHQSTEYAHAEDLIFKELEKIFMEEIPLKEMEKVKNKIVSSHVFSNMDLLNRAMNLAYYELISKAEDVNTEIEKYKSVSIADIVPIAKGLFTKQNANILYYNIQK